MKQVAGSALSSYSLLSTICAWKHRHERGGEIIRRVASNHWTSCRAKPSFINAEDIKAIECLAGSLQIGSSSTMGDNVHIFAVM